MIELDGLHRELGVSLDELVERSRSIELVPLPGVSVKLSRFTEKQMSRANPLKRTVKRRKQHYQTRRRKLRERSRKQLAQYYRFKVRFKDRWQVTLEEWQEMLWPYVGDRGIRLGGYEKDGALTPYTIWIEDNRTGEKLWEGAEERLRQDGYLL